MQNKFKSDFEMMPETKINKPGWNFRPATWTSETDPLVHKLLEDKIQGPIVYTRKRWRDDVTQNCSIYKNNNELFMNPGDDYIYKIQKVAINNREPDQNIIDNDNIPHELKCLICLDNKRTHMVTECNHVVACATCTASLMKMDPKKCPLCNTLIKKNLQKIYF